MDRHKCSDCVYRTTKDGKLYCYRHLHWLEEDTMQITVEWDMMCDFQPKVSNERRSEDN